MNVVLDDRAFVQCRRKFIFVLSMMCHLRSGPERHTQLFLTNVQDYLECM